MKKKVLIVAHDAGGAELISSWVKKNCDNYFFEYCLDGPAVSVFSRKLGQFDNVCMEIVRQQLANFDFILTGSGWGSVLEKRFIALAKQQGVTVITYLDHWTNYRKRFEWQGDLVLPNQIWVGDQHALQIVQCEFPQVETHLQPNCYIQDVVKEIYTYEKSGDERVEDDRLRVLYICEPRQTVQAGFDFWHYTEFEALTGYLNYLLQLGNAQKIIRIRLHPSEPKGKYDAIIEEYRGGLTIQLSEGTSLSQDCAWAQWVVGCDSMAMVVALFAGRKVFSCIPKEGRALTLPFPEIEQIFMNRALKGGNI